MARTLPNWAKGLIGACIRVAEMDSSGHWRKRRSTKKSKKRKSVRGRRKHSATKKHRAAKGRRRDKRGRLHGRGGRFVRG